MTIYVKPKFYRPNGTPLAGGFVKVLEAGSKSTLKTTYSNSSLTTPNPNPVVLDGEGGADIWFSGPADYEVYDSNMVLQWTQKEVYGFGSSSINIDSTNRTVRNLRADDDFDVTLGTANERCQKLIYFGCDGEPQLISIAELASLLDLDIVGYADLGWFTCDPYLSVDFCFFTDDATDFVDFGIF